MSKLLKITAVVTAVDIGPPIKLNTTSLQGGQGREALLHIPQAMLTATVKLQGAPAQADGNAPEEASTEWTDVVTLTSASDVIQMVEDLPYWIRWNTTVLDADGPNIPIYLIGQQ